MKKIFSVFLVLGLVAWIMAIASLTGCEVHNYHDDPHNYVCYEEPPFYQSPDYCDYYFAGKCCGWYVGGSATTDCFDEWCVWDEWCGWEPGGTVCY